MEAGRVVPATRAEHDRRVIIATINDASLKLLVSSIPLVHEVSRTAVAYLGEKRLRLLIDLPEDVREIYETTS